MVSNVKPVRKHRKFTCKSAFCMCLGGDASVLSPLPLCATSPPRHFRSSQTLAAYSDFAPQEGARRHILRRFIVSCAPCCCEFSADRLPSEGLSQKHTYRAKNQARIRMDDRTWRYHITHQQKPSHEGEHGTEENTQVSQQPSKRRIPHISDIPCGPESSKPIAIRLVIPYWVCKLHTCLLQLVVPSKQHEYLG